MKQDPERDKDEVIATAQSWAEAFNRGDAAGCAAHYTEDAKLVATPLADLSGRARIQAFWAELLAGGFAQVRYLDPKIEFAGPNVALLSSPWSMNLARGMIERERWERQEDGRWLLAEDHFEVLDQFSVSPEPLELVLVHGAWMGAWCWESVMAQLASRGIRSRAIDLPGHGERSRENASELRLEDYAAAVVAELESAEHPVVLAGHSFGGVVISRVAERIPEKVRALVYVAAFLLPAESSFQIAAQGVTDSEALANLEYHADQSLVGIRAEALHAAVAHDVPESEFKARLGHLVLEPTRPLGSALEVSRPRWGRIPRYAIECTEDRALPWQAQQDMYGAWAMEERYRIRSSHCCMLSKPDEVASALAQVATAS